MTTTEIRNGKCTETSCGCGCGTDWKHCTFCHHTCSPPDTCIVTEDYILCDCKHWREL